MLSTFVICDDVKNDRPRPAEGLNQGPDVPPTLVKSQVSGFSPSNGDTPSNTIVESGPGFCGVPHVLRLSERGN